MLFGEAAQCIEDMLLDCLWDDRGLALRERDQGRLEIGVVDRVVDGNRDLEATFIERDVACDTSPHWLYENNADTEWGVSICARVTIGR